METPVPSAALASAPITSVSPKRAVMIDDRAELSDSARKRSAHPAGSGRRSARCATCQVTYIAMALPPSAITEGWVCDVCGDSDGVA